MRKILSWIGAAITFIATVATLATTPWGLIVTTALAAGVASWDWAYQVVQNPRVNAAVWVFLALYWTCIGAVVLRHLKNPRSVRIFHDYAYALSPENLLLNLDPSMPNKIILNFGFRNVGAGPIKMHVEELRVILDGRTEDHPDTVGRDVLIPRATWKGYRSPAIPRDLTREEIKGTADIVVLYGHPELGYERKFHIRYEVGIQFPKSFPVEQPIFGSGILLESDSPYRP